MGRIVTTVDVENSVEPRFSKKLDALVDTGASLLTLPSAWKEQFGAFGAEEVIELQTATQESIRGTVCGPIRITVEGFRPVYNEVLFIDMEPEDGKYEPLLGYIPLGQCGAAVDLIGHRLVPVRYMDAKVLRKCRNPVRRIRGSRSTTVTAGKTLRGRAGSVVRASASSLEGSAIRKSTLE